MMLPGLILAVAAAVAGPDELPPRSGEAVAAAFRTCGVLEAAYAAAIDRNAPAAPADVRSSWRSLELERFVPDAVRSLALRPGEHDDLLANSRADRTDSYHPRCHWAATATPVPHEHAMWVSFTRPIFTTEARLALVEVSFQEEGGWGYGKLCVVRQEGAGWSARCRDSWIA